MPKNRWKTIVLGLLAAGAVSSCAVHGTVGRADLTAKPSVERRYDEFTAPPGQKVRAYTTQDGAVHEFDGSAWIDRDSVVFARNQLRHRVALADLVSVEAEETDWGRTVFLALGLAALSFGIWFLSALSQMD